MDSPIKSKDLWPGAVLRAANPGLKGLRVIRERKEDDSGWWVNDSDGEHSGGLHDSVIDGGNMWRIDLEASIAALRAELDSTPTPEPRPTSGAWRRTPWGECDQAAHQGLGAHRQRWPGGPGITCVNWVALYREHVCTDWEDRYVPWVVTTTSGPLGRCANHAGAHRMIDACRDWSQLYTREERCTACGEVRSDG